MALRIGGPNRPAPAAGGLNNDTRSMIGRGANVYVTIAHSNLRRWW
jgi:hypothetical protein